VAVVTDYPFREGVAITVKPERPVAFPLLLRVPAWAEGATVRLAGGPEVAVKAGSFYRVAREWRGETQLALRLPMRPAVTTRYDDAIALERGPLVYSLQLGEQWTRIHADEPHRELPHGDFEVRATTPWNYGLVLDPRRPEAGVAFEERPLGERPFAPDGAGVVARARGRRISAWKLAAGWAGEISRADSAWAHPPPADATGPVEEVRLVPYGCTNVRVTELPLLLE